MFVWSLQIRFGPCELLTTMKTLFESNADGLNFVFGKKNASQMVYPQILNWLFADIWAFQAAAASVKKKTVFRFRNLETKCKTFFTSFLIWNISRIEVWESSLNSVYVFWGGSAQLNQVI